MSVIKLLLPMVVYVGTAKAHTTELNIPLAGNGFLTSVNQTTDSISEKGITNWKDAASEFSVYFRTDTPCILQLGMALSVPVGSSKIQVTVNNKSYALSISGTTLHTVFADESLPLKPGYTKIVLHGLQKTGEQFAFVTNLVLKTSTTANTFHFVKENSGNRFYWGRRGPSLHLLYETPKHKNIEWFYNELIVPKGGDAVGSYFMADGFKEGYFGMQVNSASERRILFSIWSPFITDDPSAIPEDEKIMLLKKGDRVHTGEFGEEGAGGQSYFIYPWKAGNTYRFLVHAAPDEKGNSIYTAYFFAPEEDRWLLIAGFQRPKTNTYLTKLHSFIENFIDTNGFLSRRCQYSNQWAIDNNGTWHEITTAYFTGDDIANVQYRIDYKAGADKNVFFLQNGGFINDYVHLKQYFTRDANGKHPEIDFSSLP